MAQLETRRAARRAQNRQARTLVRGAPLVATLVVVLGLVALPTRVGATPTSTPAALTVVDSSPAPNATAVTQGSTISLTFSQPLKQDSATPIITPAIAGTWHLVTPDQLVFSPTGPLAPATTYVITVPSGPKGARSTTGAPLASPYVTRFTVADGSTLRLQQLLAQLGYLPVTFTPDHPLLSARDAAEPQQGTFTWRFMPVASLAAAWTPGVTNVATRGAVMTFENTHGLAADGSAGPEVWQALLAAATTGTGTTAPYNYVYVTKVLPERTTVYSNGAVAYSTLANTGAPSVPTADGTFPVFEHEQSAEMKGTNPNGTKYDDPNIPWVSYFHGGDALHGYVRAAYGFPQSDGCVEMPPANAAIVYPYTPIGTLVTVAG